MVLGLEPRNLSLWSTSRLWIPTHSHQISVFKRRDWEKPRRWNFVFLGGWRGTLSWLHVLEDLSKLVSSFNEHSSCEGLRGCMMTPGLWDLTWMSSACSGNQIWPMAPWKCCDSVSSLWVPQYGSGWNGHIEMSAVLCLDGDFKDCSWLAVYTYGACPIGYVSLVPISDL